jgi:tRNA(Leu) C34 or U34 (ribose-2'-O)-methylase TrmL
LKRVVFYPDRPVDREGDLFFALLAELGIDEFEIEGDPAGADFVVFVGKERAREALGRAVKSGPQAERLEGAEVYVLPSTAPEQRGRFFEGAWRSFAAHLLGRDLAVRDEYKGLSPEQVKAALEPRRFDFSVLVANLVYDFNLGSIIRTANAFLAREVCIYGRKKADLRGAMGSYIYENVIHLPDLEALDRHAAAGGWSVVCFEEVEGAEPLAGFRWPERPLMVFGQEGPGVPEELRRRADFTVVIPQFGSIRSLNAGVAAGIAMYDWHAKR